MEDRNTHQNDAAYPMNIEYNSCDSETGIPSINTKTSFGLTKLEYFAAMAMQGLCTKCIGADWQILARDSVDIATALISELNKQ